MNHQGEARPKPLTSGRSSRRRGTGFLPALAGPVLTPRTLPAILLAALLAFLVAQFSDLFELPFITDDYLFLDKTRATSFPALWAPVDLVAGYYRPWSREFHYWALDRVGCGGTWPFHVASAVLWIVAIVIFFDVARHVGGVRAATIATCGVVASAAWGAIIVWPAGSQELWMITAGLAFLSTFIRGRNALAVAALALALLSKETAAVLPLIAASWALLVDGRDPGQIARQIAPHALVVLVWASVHPLLLARLWSSPLPSIDHEPQDPAKVLVWTLLSLVNLDARPAPESGWVAALRFGLPAALVLVAALIAGLWWTTNTPSRPHAGSTAAQVWRSQRARGACRWGLAWAGLGWAPLFTPWLGWHAYYTLFGALGAWIALGVFLERRRGVALALIATLTLLRAGRSNTPTMDLGSEWYQRWVGLLTDRVHDDLLRLRPTIPRGSRVFFSEAPGGIGLIAGPGDSPAMRIWYRDRSIEADFFSRYSRRPPASPTGIDLFFCWDSTLRAHEVVKGPEDLRRGLRENPLWAMHHYHLATVLYLAGELDAARTELEKLVTVYPKRYEYALKLTAVLEAQGDSGAAARWRDRATSLPGAAAGEQRTGGRP